MSLWIILIKKLLIKAKSESKLEKLIFQYIASYFNIWLGEHKAADWAEMHNNDTKELDQNSEIYKAKLEKAKYGFPINHVKKDSIPTLCIYGGKDLDIGIGHYSLLKSYFDQKGNKNIELIYSKNSIHNIFENPPEIKDKLYKEMFSKILDYSDKYFSKD